MPLIVPSAAEKTLQDFMLGVTVPGNQKLKLFVNNVTVDDTFTAASLTEMTTHGYTDKTLTKTSWVSVAGATGNPSTSTFAQQTWTFTAASLVSVYGYYITDVTTGLLLWAENFNSAKPIVNGGDQILITPTITLSRV